MAGLFAANNAVNKALQGDRLARGRNSAFMDSCQLIRKETKMEVAHLNQKQLAARWSISEATLERFTEAAHARPYPETAPALGNRQKKAQPVRVGSLGVGGGGGSPVNALIY